MTKEPPLLRLQERRAHEICGPGAVFFAIVQAAQTRGTVLWVREAWKPDQINPTGFHAILDPGLLIFAKTVDQSDTLAVAEEALRSGAVSMVIMEVGKPIGLTEGRRLQLAARDGGATALAIIPEGGGSNAAETRWQCAPVFNPSDSTLHHWKLIKNKSGTIGAWYVRWDLAANRLDVVSPVVERPGSAGTPD